MPIFLLIIFLLCAFNAKSQTNTMTAGIDWNSGTWSLGHIPLSSENAVINAGLSVQITTPAVCATLQINNSTNNTSTSVTINAGQTLTVGAGTGAITIGSASAMGNGNINSTSLIVNGTLLSGNINQTPGNRLTGSGGNGRTNLTVNASGIVTVLGNVTGTSLNGTGTNTASASVIFTGTGTLNVTGTFTTSVFTPSTGIVNYNGTSLQTLNAAYTTYGTLKVNNSVGVNLGAPVTLTNLTIGDIKANSILNDNGNQITSTGTLNLSSGNFNIGSGASNTIYPAFGTNTIAAGTTVNYNSTGPQTIRAVNYANLTNSGNGTRTLAPAGTIRVSGSFTPGNGAYTITTSTVNFNGTLVQTIPAFTFNNLVIDNNAGISSIGGNVTINNSLALTNGVITTGANKIIVTNGGSVSRTNGWINGNLQQYISNTGTYKTYPIGNATVYRPLRIIYFTISTPGNLTVAQLTGFHPQIASSGLDNITPRSITPYWNLTSDGLAGVYDAIFGYISSDIPAGAVFGNFVVRNFNSSWTAPTTGLRTAISTEVEGQSTFGDFAIGERHPVPSVLLQPVNTSVCNGNTALLTSTSSSIPAPTVKWQRSTDGITWVDILASTDGGSVYTNFTTNTLTISGAVASINGYRYRSVYTNINGTVNSSSATLTVTQPSTITLLEYATSPFAKITSSPQSVTLTGTNSYTGGTFTSDAGLSINSVTGDIRPDLSTIGNHTITYTTAAVGGCGAITSTTIINITTAPTAIINYIPASFCILDNTAYTINLSGTGAYTGGNYTATSGLAIDASGTITPNASTAGLHTVTYNIPAFGPYPKSTVTTDVIITPVPTAFISYSGGPFCTSDETAQTATLTGTGAFSGGTFSSDAGLVIDPITGAFTPNGSTGGTHIITYTIPASGGCAAVPVTTSVTIVTRPAATLSYSSSYCLSITSAQFPVLTGTSGGTYSSPDGLIIDASTGAFTPGNNAAGNYTVLYSIPASGPCGIVQITADVSIVDSPTGSISYPGQPFCTADVPRPVTLVGTGVYLGGTYSSTLGLNINSSTGIITPSTSIPGTYLVKYTTLNCPVEFTTFVEINGAPNPVITYSGTPFCQSDGSANPAILTGGDVSGIFSAPLGLSINSVNGDITPSTSNAGTYTVTYTIPGSGTCPDIVKTTLVTVTPAVGTPTAITIGNGLEPTCQLVNGTTTTTYATSVTNSTSLNWSLSNSSAGVISSTGLMTWANGFSGTVNIQVSANGCNGISSPVIRTVTVTPTVSTPTAITVDAGIEPACQIVLPTTTTYGSTANNSLNLNWSVSNAAAGSINSSGIMTWTAGFSGTVNIQVTASGCNGPSTQVIRTVNITPTVSTPAAITISAGTEPPCQITGSTPTTTYSTSATNNSGFNWSISNAAAGTIDAISGVMTWATGFSGSVNIQVIANGCNGPSAQVIRTVIITPAVGIPTAVSIFAGNEPTCQLTNATTTTTYATTSTNSSGFNWSISNASAGFINASTGLMTWTSGFSGSVDIRVTANGCNGPSAQVFRTVNISPTVGTPTPISISSGIEPVCQLTNGTTTTTYATTTTNNTGFNWTLSNNAAGSISSGGVMTWANGFSGTVFIQVTANGCNGPSTMSLRRVTINPPFTPSITALPSSVICLGQAVTFSASGFSALGDISGGSFNNANPPGWSGDNANNSNGADNSDWGEANGGKSYNGKIYNNPNTPSGGKFMIVNGLTNSASNISILSSPVFSTVGRISASLEWWEAYNFAAGSIGKVEISLDGGVTYQATPLLIYQGVLNSPSTNTFTKASIDLNAYLGQSNLKIRFYYLGTTGSNWALDDVNITGSYQAISYTWPPGFTVSGNTATITPLSVGTYTYKLTTTYGGCASTTANFTITVNPLPTISLATASSGNVIVCYSTVGQLAPIIYSGSNLTSPTTYNIVWSAAAISAGFENVNAAALPLGSLNLSVPASAAAGTYTGTVTVNNGSGCSNAGSPFSLTINPMATLGGVSSAPVCNGPSLTVDINGLLANSTSTIIYTLGSASPVSVSGIVSNSSGIGSFPIAVTAANNGQILTINSISSTTASNSVSCFTPLITNNTVTLSISDGYIWTGNGVNNLWTNAANWTVCGVPGNGTSVTIPDVSNKNYPMLDVDFISNNFNLLGNATIKLNGFTLTLGTSTVSVIKEEGSVIGSSTSNLILQGSFITDLKFDQTADGISNSLKNITLNSNGQTVNLGNPLKVIGNLIPTTGVLSSNGNLTMVSTATTTSNIGSFTAGADVSGIVNVESWLTGGPATNSVSTNANRGTRTMSSPVNDATTSVAVFKQLQAYMFITGSGSGGFDVYPTDPFAETLFTYKESATYDQGALAQYNLIPDINNTRIPAGLGFFLYYRGDKSDNNTAAGSKVVSPFDTPESMSITYRGQINKGNVNMNLSYTPNSGLRDPEYNGFNLVGNPYPATIDWTKVTRSNNSIVDNMIAIIRPGGGMITYSGGIITNGGQGAIPSGASVADPNYTPEIPYYIQPGQGFYVRTRAANSFITFTENSKAISVAGVSTAPARLLSNGLVTQNSLQPKILRLTLKDDFNTDETAIVFKKDFDASFGALDATYLAGSSVTLSSQTSDGKNMAINFMPDINDVSEIGLTVNSASSGNLKLNFLNVIESFDQQVFLKDIFLNNITNVKENPVYEFLIDRSNSLTFGSERFKIIFKEPLVTKVKYFSFVGKAVRLGSELKWITDGEVNNDYFEVEHSRDGISYSTIGKIKGAGNTSVKTNYIFLDEKPYQGINYYRLKQFDLQGQYTHSEVITITNINPLKANFSVFPNPARNELNLKIDLISNQPIQLNIYNTSSQKVITRTFTSLNYGEYFKQDITSLNSGVYIVELIDLGNKEFINRAKFIKE
ncbi:T9SS type A sorting domain-containing protein [Daejeonella oryzae]|uniref:T9SS type A sorting domain-containing protein n=1 Tax=Daejeonella oryzae TaxID=1122943 RepID=UPI0012DE54C8|nr:T9SS type A sorting domain-containing protein [Daejeonella oryzae]